MAKDKRKRKKDDAAEATTASGKDPCLQTGKLNLQLGELFLIPRGSSDNRLIGQLSAVSENPDLCILPTGPPPPCSLARQPSPPTSPAPPAHNRPDGAHSGPGIVDRSRFSRITVPALGSRSAIARSSKVLPAPDGPLIAIHSPIDKAKDAGLRIAVRRSRTRSMGTIGCPAFSGSGFLARRG